MSHETRQTRLVAELYRWRTSFPVAGQMTSARVSNRGRLTILMVGASALHSRSPVPGRQNHGDLSQRRQNRHIPRRRWSPPQPALWLTNVRVPLPLLSAGVALWNLCRYLLRSLFLPALLSSLQVWQSTRHRIPRPRMSYSASGRCRSKSFPGPAISGALDHLSEIAYVPYNKPHAITGQVKIFHINYFLCISIGYCWLLFNQNCH
ncbi:hypothetical protein MSHOH_0925 [Methanosarcina horonobensis HB-1 = JCM 15518]|uniref:Uncharacterized protein n=1 Tax=Methanosarcina horonobensis HB-1 = JCM 15518 TaxID=1434110 RepID=A0A0E3SDB1_9EURY|nr:hypothetical protein MSHOH_0925 [Methanosarcina horonobensis HB-1 = JCM 15518]